MGESDDHVAPHTVVSSALRSCNGAVVAVWLRALQLGQASQVAPVDKLSVVLVMLLGVLVLGEHLNWKQWLGGALILAGVILVAMPTSTDKAAPQTDAVKTASKF